MSIASVAVVTAFLLPGFGASVPSDNAPAAAAPTATTAPTATATATANANANANAAKCAAAPNGAPPQGQHWYYRLDHVSHRKCWYLHAIVALAPQAEAERPAQSARTELTRQPIPSARPSTSNVGTAWPAPSALPSTRNVDDTASAAGAPPSVTSAGTAQPAASAPLPENNPDAAQPEPHVTVLNVKQVSTPFVGTSTRRQQQTPENTITPPVQQTLPPEENSANTVDNPTDNAEKAPLQAVPDAAQQEVARTTETANAAEQPNMAGMFLLLALAFGAAAVLIAIATRFARRYGEPRISHHPDNVWVGYRAALQPDEEASYDEGPYDEAAYDEARYEAMYDQAKYDQAKYDQAKHDQARHDQSQYDQARYDHAQYDEQEVPFLDPQAEHALADLHEQQWIDRSSPAEAELSPARYQDDDPETAKPPELGRKEIELALRILRRARQSRVA